jgi:acyl-homoserine lactone acylase PvdQ
LDTLSLLDSLPLSVGLPDTVWLGPGTGGAAEPAPCTAPAEDGTTPQAAATTAAGSQVPLRTAGLPSRRELLAGLGQLRGGSWAVAIGRARTRDGGALLISAPQLSYYYPSYLWEAEIHGAGYEARGVSVPGLPVIGIGYSPHVAWALTTGYSKTIDSFIETTCSSAQVGAGTCAANQYFHNGQWRDMECRTETIPYRASSSETGLPSGTASLSTAHEVCRTVHGPVVARDDGAGLARTLTYAMWMREIDNGQ